LTLHQRFVTPDKESLSVIRVFSHYISLRIIFAMVIEGVLLFCSTFAGLAMRFWALPNIPLSQIVPVALLFTLLMIVSMSAVGLYHKDRHEPLRVTVQKLAIAFALGMPIMSLMFYLFPDTYIGRGVLGISSIIAFVSIMLTHLLFFHWTSLGVIKRRILLLGGGQDAQNIIELFRREGDQSIDIVGVHPLASQEIIVDSKRILPAEMGITEAVKRFNVDEIIITVREQRGGALPLRQLLDCKLRGVQVTDLSSFFERELGQIRLETLKASWLIFGDGCRQGLLRETVKRVFDLVASTALLLVTLPVMLITTAIIAMEGGGSILYRQERVGQGGRIFEVLKFRSMRSDAERDGKPQWATTNDSRVTPIGKFIRRSRIDELPQIFNVLRGEMSFVGPRPERPFFVQQLVQEIPFYAARHSVKPGITGWAQVRYPYGASLDDAVNKLQYDLYYVKNHTFFLDLLILVETIQVVLWGKGAR
jgi:sugar transferase (PEP-CTERM system associated)